MDCILYEDSITVIIEDHGVGIEDIEKRGFPHLHQNPNWKGREWVFNNGKLYGQPRH